MTGKLIRARVGPEAGSGAHVADRSVLARFRDARHLALGSVHRAPDMIIQSIRSATLESEGDIEFHLDGEPGVVRDRLTVTIRPGALMVKV